MNTKFPHIPWPDPNFNENSSKLPVEELWRYAGQHIAWSWDGTRILAGARTNAELDDKLKEAGIDPSRVVFDYVYPLDVSSIL